MRLGLAAQAIGGSVLAILGIDQWFQARERRRRALEISRSVESFRTSLAEEAARRERVVDALMERHRRSEQAERDLIDATASLHRRVDVLNATLDRTASELRASIRDGLKAEVDRSNSRMLERIQEERSMSALTIAHSVSRERPARVLLLLTIHRSGSTRLLDMVRTHPAVRFHPTYEVWEQLGLHGRRYPVAFSNTKDGRLAAEVEAGVGAVVPAIRRFDDQGAVDLDDTWLVEKAHPQFFDYEVAPFLERVERARENGLHTTMVLGVRRPLDAMWSMVEFKRRQPSWYAWLSVEEVPLWIARSLEALEQVSNHLDSLVIDFDEIPRGASIHELGRLLGPSLTPGQVDTWVAHAGEATRRSDRAQASGSGFIGEQDTDRSSAGPNGSWSGLGEILERAEQAYANLTLRVRHS